jgi:hypothetical protein
MTLRSQSPSSFLLVALCAGAIALVAAGCDSTGSGDAEPADTNTFEVTIENVGTATPLLKSGAFTPADVINDNNNVPPLEPGEAFQFSFTAGPTELPGTGTAFSFAAMFVQSNDAYYAFEPGGLALFESDGTPIGQGSPRDVTDQVRLYDAGTEVDQEPGTGPDQAPRQSSLDQGADEDGTVVRMEDTDGDAALEDSGFEYPAVADGVEVTVSSEADEASGGYEFTVTIENVGGGSQVNGAPLILSPGSYAVHFDQMPGGEGEVTYPGHAPGASASGGIEAIAEDGRPAGALSGDAGTPAGNHVEALRARTGVTVPLSPGAYAVHSDAATFHNVGGAAATGIERIAEDGTPGEMVSALSGLDAVTTADAFGDGPIPPGSSVTFTVDAEPGDRLSFATMYIQSNDLFYAFEPEGLALFDANDEPIDRTVTGAVRLYDAGTETDQEPGVGLDQAIRQAEGKTGADEGGSIVRVQNTDGDAALEDDGFEYAPTASVVSVRVQPQ